MKKRFSGILAVLCYVLGILASFYIGIWLMLIMPIRTLISAYLAGELGWFIIVTCLIRILLSITIAGFIWCVGYYGYTRFGSKEKKEWELESEADDMLQKAVDKMAEKQ